MDDNYGLSQGNYLCNSTETFPKLGKICAGKSRSWQKEIIQFILATNITMH